MDANTGGRIRETVVVVSSVHIWETTVGSRGVTDATYASPILLG